MLKKRFANYAPLLALPLILAVCFLLLPLLSAEGYTDSRSETGVWDLRDFDFENGYVRLLGPVEYIPNALLTPEEFDARSDEAVLGHPQTDHPSTTVTSRSRVLLPDGCTYAIAGKSVDFAERLFLNGELMAEIGSPGGTKEDTIHGTSTHYYMSRPEGGELVIVRQAANFVHREGGWHNALQIGYPKYLRDGHGHYAYAIVMGCYLALFVVHLALYSIMRDYPANLYFSLFCLVWFFRTGVIESKVFSILLPNFPWAAKFRIEYLSLPLAAILLIGMLHRLFPKVLPRWLRRVVYAVSGAFAVFFLLADTLIMSWAMLGFYGCCGVFALLLLYFFIRRLRGPTLPQIVSIVGSALFVYAGLRDMLYYNHIILPPFIGADVSKIAMLIFVFFQMTAMFMGTVFAAAEAKAMEQKLAADNAALDRLSRMKSDLLATVSHETRTPLAVLSGYAELISMEMRAKGVEEQTAKDLNQIADEAQRLAAIMEEMQQLSRGKDANLKKSAISPGDLIGRTARLYEPILARKHTRLTLAVPGGLPAVYANPDEVSQVLFNLLSNARNHTEHGEVTITAEGADGMVAITVADTGAGIPADLLPQIFQRGVHGDPEGSGIGLAVCKEIVEGHGGTIAIKSKPGKGTAVRFTLPIFAEKEGIQHERNRLIG